MSINISFSLIKLPEDKGYKYCEKCDRWVANENRHCERCRKCTSKNGSTYVHCMKCKRCVKSTWVHCQICRICTQIEHCCVARKLSKVRSKYFYISAKSLEVFILRISNGFMNKWNSSVSQLDEIVAMGCQGFVDFHLIYF